MTDPRVLDDAMTALRQDGAVALVGGRGAGRTTALRGLGARLGRRRDVVRVHGRIGFADHPLASFGPLGGNGPAEALALLVTDRPFVLVDDPHLLHAVDLAVLADAAARGTRLALAATTEATVPPQLAALLGELPQVPLAPLDEDALAAVASSMSDGRHIDATDIAALVTATGARPGLVRRVLDGAGITVVGDLAVLPHPLAATPGAIAWCRERVAEPSRHRAARLVAGSSGLSASEIAAVVGAAMVDELLDVGLARLVGEGLMMRDPLLGATLREVDCRIHAREDAAALLDAIGHQVDAERRHRWQVEAGRSVTPDVRAAVVMGLVADGQPRAALRAAAADDAPSLAFARARAHAAAGQVDQAAAEAGRVLASAGPLPEGTDRSLRTRAGILLGDLLWFRRADAAGALRVLQQVADDVEAAAIADLLRLATGEEPVVTQDGPRADMVPLARQLVELRAVLAGDVADPDELAPIPDEPHPAGVPVRQRALTNRTMAALYGPGVAAAAPLVAHQVGVAVATGRPGALALALYGRCELERHEGRLADAERTLRAVRVRAGVDDEAGLGELLAASHATVLAELGRLEDTEHALPTGQSTDLRARLAGTAAHVRLLASHDRSEAAEAARDGVGAGLATGHAVWAVEVALHAARVGLADEVAPLVGELRAAPAAAAAAAAAAVCAWTSGATSDHRRSCADRLAAVGRRRVAAELLLSTDAPSPADRRRAAALLEGLGPPHPDLATPVGALTDREHQVAVLAADGRTSRDVAAVLGISVRTVDNHLRRVYHKLGVDGREQLALVLRG